MPGAVRRHHLRARQLRQAVLPQPPEINCLSRWRLYFSAIRGRQTGGLSMQSPPMSTVKFVRPNGYADRLRDYKIFANGTLRGHISAKSALEFEIPSGPVTFRGRIDWGRSKPLTIEAKPGEVITIEVTNTWGAFLALWAISFGSGSYLTLKRVA
jgi:hypothetical protein